MRTLIIIPGGLVLWGVSHGVARLPAGSMKTATIAFVVFVAPGRRSEHVDRHLAGRRHVQGGIPYLLIFLLPVTAVVLLKWKFR